MNTTRKSAIIVGVLFISINFFTNCSSKNTKVTYDFGSNFLNNNINFIQLEKLNIEYIISGENNNETILFVHGLGANFIQFEKQHTFFSDKYKVISINLRGHGNSNPFDTFDETDFALNEISKDIIDLLDKLDIEKVHFIGNSMGGNIGYELIKSYPNRLLSFTSFGTTAQLKKSIFSISIRKLLHKIMSTKTIGKLTSSSGQTESSKNIIASMYFQTSKSTILNIIPYLSNFDYLQVIKNSNIPCMIIIGEKDKEINEVINSTILEFENRGNFQLIKFQGAGHFVNLDKPILFNSELYKFLKTVNKSI